MTNSHSNPFPVLKTARLTLRQLATGDEQQIFILRSDSGVNKYLDRQKSRTIDDAKDFIHRILNSDALYWAITLNDKNTLVGTVCLFGFPEQQYRCEIGYELLTDFQGQGIMKEAVQRVLTYAFNTMKVKRIEAWMHRDNTRSIKLLENLSFGFSDEPDPENPELVCLFLENSTVGDFSG